MLNAFKLSDSEKANIIFDMLNPEYNSEHDWKCEYSILNIYDDYVLCWDVAGKQYMQIEYTKDDETNTVTIGDMHVCYIVDVTEEELSALNTIRALNGNSFTKLDENFVSTATLTEKNEEHEQAIKEYDLKIEEFNAQIATFNTEKDELVNAVSMAKDALDTANNNIASLQGEVDSLKEYKLNIETTEKQGILAKYTDLLDESIINAYSEKLSEYTCDSLDKDLAYELVKSNPTVFNKEPQQQYFVKDTPLTGIEAILSKYKK